MKLFFHRKFEKGYKRLRKNEQKRVWERISSFRENPFRPILENHPLQGKYKGYRSINISGNLRAVYKYLNQDTIIFVAIDTHSNLYY